jgi:acyl-coenzyme A synthetase/AMP-(fatty) acid ligase
VTIWYTAPTAVRMMMKAGTEIIRKYDLSSLRFIAVSASRSTLKRSGPRSVRSADP